MQMLEMMDARAAYRILADVSYVIRKGESAK
jgi:hypothetical protein